jgi:hypothetical protein
MEEAVHVATSPHDFKLMVSAGGRRKGEGQAQGPGALPARPEPDAAGIAGVATVAEPPPEAAPAAPAPPPVQAPPAAPSAPPPGF